MKTILENAMITYVNEMEKISDRMRDAYSKAVEAAHRGDSVNYRKHSKTITELGGQLAEMKDELDKIKAAYAAI